MAGGQGGRAGGSKKANLFAFLVHLVPSDACNQSAIIIPQPAGERATSQAMASQPTGRAKGC